MAILGFGVDVGGSGIKGAVVDLEQGGLASERFKVATPQPSTPQAVAVAVADVVAHFGWQAPFGSTFPAVVQKGVARTAANVDPSWVGTNVQKVLEAATGLDVTVVNDADAAGLAESLWGAAKGIEGLVVVVTLGTGIGTALLYDGVLVPNSELGHIELDGEDYEVRASAAAREREDLSWEKWAKRLQRYFTALEFYLRPSLFVVGGGVSKRAERFLPLLALETPVVAARFQNEAGIAGAAYLASKTAPSPPATLGSAVPSSPEASKPGVAV
ncbi:MAG TPA: ROK family protein [Acidimicrobiales bacterium]|nr:ROK family protein [Acidimicrobiales bacterium]